MSAVHLRINLALGVLLFAAITAGPSAAQTQGGDKIPLTSGVRVIDGDTLEGSIDGSLTGIGILGIRAARGNTECGELARRLTAEMLYAPGATLELDSTYQQDAHGRRLFYIVTGGGQSVARELVSAGLARATGTGRDATDLARAEGDAKADNRGCINDFPEDKDEKKDQYVAAPIGSFRDHGGTASWPAHAARAGSTSALERLPAELRHYARLIPEATAFASLPDGRVLIAVKSGVVLMVRNGVIATEPFIDLRRRVNAYWNRGLIEVAVDPQFQTNGFVYLLYTYENDPLDYTGPKTLQLLRVKANGDTASVVQQDVVPVLGTDVGAGCELLAASNCIEASTIGQPAPAIKFSPDGAVALQIREATQIANFAVTAATIAPTRVNAGGTSYTDPQGNVWAADTGFSGGRVYTTSSAIANTTTPVLYRSERFNTTTLAYNFAVPNGNYTVRLKFAEIYFTAAGRRVFHIVLNGQTVQMNFDIFAEAGGAFRAVDRSYPLAVSNGSVAIQLTPVVENPKINAIEIVPVDTGAVAVSVTPTASTRGPSQTQQFTATVSGTTNTAVTWSITPNVGTISNTGLYTAPASIVSQQNVSVTATSQADATKSASAIVTLTPATTSFTPIRINAGGSSYTDPQGNVWGADTGYSGGRVYSTSSPIANTTTPNLYQSERFSSTPLNYTFAVPNGTYSVTLKFAENYFTSAARRVFDIAVNGQTVQMNFDIFAEAGGANRALDRSYVVSTTNGQIVIGLTPRVENAKINAIQISQGTQVVGVSVSPQRVVLAPSQTQLFTAALAGDSSGGFTWSLSPNVGTISSGGLYTAPSTITSEQSVTVRATSQSDATKSGTAVVTLLPSATFSWVTRATSPIGRMEAQGAVANGKLYVFGGFTANWTTVTARADVYDPATNTWTQIANVPEQLTHSAVAVDGATIYLIGGYVGGHPGPSSERVWRYDTVGNRWAPGPALPSTRGGGAAARVGRFLYFFGGATRSAGTLDDTDVPAAYRLALDGGTAWTRIADMPNPRNHIGGIALGGKVYAIGGQHEHDEGPGNQAEVDVFDPGANTWTRVADLPKPGGHIAVVELEGRILVMGNGPATSDVRLYDATKNVWLRMPPLPQARASAVAGVVGGAVIVTTGHSGNGVASTVTWRGEFAGKWEVGPAMPVALGEVAGGILGKFLYLVGEGNTATLRYDLGAGTWSSTAAPARPYPGHHHAAEVFNGKLYLLGGLGLGSEGKVQIYDPATNVWTLGQPMPFAAGSSSSAVINGEIFVAGGIVGGSTTPLSGAYNPATNTWRTVAPMPRGLNHSASATDGSKLYVFGGRTGGNVVGNGESTVQVYNAATNTWTSDVTGAALAPLPQARGGMGKAVYVNGEFYVIGGETLDGPGATSARVYNRVDIYNPLTNSWRLGTRIPTARHGIFPAAIGGRIYVAGGGIQAGASTSARLEIVNVE